MSSTSKAWFVATSIGAVEAMKDQFGVCRWNYGFRLIQQHMHNNKNNLMRSYATFQDQKPSDDGPTSSNKISRREKLKQSEESLRKVMYLSCWGPN
ncbi:hypothetical protein OROGR_012361 [Orobanche gracilis]